MQSIKYIPGSDGVNNASMATVQNARSAGATTNIVNTVSGFPDFFYGSMGTPHTFTDPQTGETITIISEATARDFAGHIDSGNIEIDAFAPGQTDIGSQVGDIIIVRPTTEWANNIHNILSESFNDDGSLKAVVDNPGWTDIAFTPTTTTYLGNRSYQQVFNGVDLTGVMSPGMRLRETRTVAAPTQCTDLESSSSQYFSRASGSVTGMTFTDDFVVSAWVKLESYATQAIVSRYNGTSGWEMLVLANGTIELSGYNASSANVSKVVTYQSLPLNKWVHIAAQLDMSAFTATTTTSYIMLDGVDVPAAVSRTGTNPTSIPAGGAGNLEIGARNGGTLPFDGKIAQVAIYSAKVTQATIKASMNQTLSGSETSLISAYSFNNSINDLSANANNLTANGGALATNADSPFSVNSFGIATGTTDYGIVTSCTFSTNTTVVVQVPEGNTIPTTGGVSAVSYSGIKAPYGMPIARDKWRIETILKSTTSQTSPVNNTWYNIASLQMNLPVGAWGFGYFGGIYFDKTTATLDMVITLSTANNTESDPMFTSMTFLTVSGATTVGSLQNLNRTDIATTVTSATQYYLNARTTQTSGTISFRGDAPMIIRADNAYL